ncbi:MAG: hypothetical protein ACLFU9_07080 [Candidatus Bathyarchaeia archaeon]
MSGILKKLFWKEKKKEEEKPQEQAEKVDVTNLEKISSDDPEVFSALQHTMFLDPRQITSTLEEASKKAAELEKEGDNDRARIWYHIAGGLALWKGDAAKVKRYFGKCAKLAPEMDYELITKVPDKAVAKAQEYYEKFLKETHSR